MIVHAFFLYIPYKLEYKSLKLLVPLYLAVISFILYLNAVFYWHFGQITVFMWYMIIPIAVLVFFSARNAAIWIFVIFLMVSSVFLVTPFFPEYFFQTKRPTDGQFVVINISTIGFSLLLVFFFVYYFNKVNVLKVLREQSSQEELTEIKEVKLNEEENDTKFNLLHEEIIKFFSAKEPFRDPDYTISELAKSLDTNIKYIAKAIKTKDDINFNTFLNRYRIDMVKSMLNNDYQSKYTIRYIYTFAGFRNQSTFNKAFKQIEDTTPSEYIKTRLKTDNINKSE